MTALPTQVHSYECCGVRIDALQPEDARDALVASRHGLARSVHLCNAYTLSIAVRDDSFRQLLNRGDLNLPDGTPVAWAGRRLGFPHMKQRVYGPSLFEQTLDAGRGTGLRHYIYGSTRDVVDLLVAMVKERFPGVIVVGAESPPFRPVTDREIDALAQRVSDTAADIVWIGLGTPKQDVFVDAYATRLQATLVAVGAAFDFVAGSKRQAPQWVQNHALEWLYRLLTEPRRLWRRYIVGNTVFLLALARQWRERRR